MGVVKEPRDGRDEGAPGGVVEFSQMEIVAEAPSLDVSTRQRTLGFMRAWISEAPAELVQIQPKPYRTRVGYHPIPGGTVTLIHRWWRPGDAERCGLCPAGSCCASDGSCAINVDGKVPKADAPMFDSTPTSALVGDRERFGRAFVDDLRPGHIRHGGQDLPGSDVFCHVGAERDRL
jgi:hypothetical protein